MADASDQKDTLLKRIAELEHEINIREGNLIHDVLTGLKTLAFFEEELDMYLSIIANTSTSRRKEWFGFKNMSIMFFDVDDFKSLNNTHGQEAGDTVLKKIAQIINESVREGDTVARWGGEEIVTILLGSSESNAREKADTIRKKIEELTFGFDQERRITVSVGVVSTDVGNSSKDLFNRVNKALYKAKMTGKNKVIAFSDIR